MICLIAGRSGAGKDTFVNRVIELSRQPIPIAHTQIQVKPWTVLKSYATRPPRIENEDTHIFITKEEAAAYTDKIASTKIGEYEYFATAEQVNNADLYVIDPNGIEELIKNMPDTEFQIIYIQAEDDLQRRIHAVKRTENKIKEEEIFAARDKAEDEQFTLFEAKINHHVDDFPENVNSVIIFKNDYTEKTMDEGARSLILTKKQIENMCDIVQECIGLGIISESEETDAYGNNKITAVHEIDGKPVKKAHTIEHCAIQILSNKDTFYDVLGEYITLRK